MERLKLLYVRKAYDSAASINILLAIGYLLLRGAMRSSNFETLLSNHLTSKT